jgi:hypothetical protein
VTRRWQSQEEFNYDGVELMNVSAATSAFVRFVHAFWLRVCVVGGIGWTLMGGARSSSLYPSSGSSVVCYRIRPFRSPSVGLRRWRHLFRGSILFALSEHFAVSLERRLSHSSSCLAPSCPPPSSNIAAVVDNSRRFLRETSPEGQDLWDASTLLYGCI